MGSVRYVPASGQTDWGPRVTARRGITTTELICASILTGATLATVLPTVYVVRKQYDRASQQHEARAAVMNLLDDVTAEPYDAVTNESLRDVKLPKWVDDQFVEPALTLTAKPAADGKRISAELSWQASYGSSREKLRLHTWIFKGGSR